MNASSKQVMACGDSRKVLQRVPDNVVDLCLTDPPYELDFMGLGWDKTGIAFDVTFWREVCRVIKPGAYLMAFGGTRTYHRMACAVEDAGFEIRDELTELYSTSEVFKNLWRSLSVTQRALFQRAFPDDARFTWLYGEGMPKVRLDGSGRSPALKPNHEPVLIARKSFKGSLKQNLSLWGTGALNIDSNRTGNAKRVPASPSRTLNKVYGARQMEDGTEDGHNPNVGRWPANVAITHDSECNPNSCVPGCPALSIDAIWSDSEGGASRYWYGAKPSPSEKGEYNQHKTVKPKRIVRYLARLGCPPGGLVLDPFAGSGTTGVVCVEEGLDFLGVELERDSCETAKRRIAEAQAQRVKAHG